MRNGRSYLYGAVAGTILGAAFAVCSRKRNSLEGQVVLITGGSRGLGLALAREFASQGCKIAICARDERHLEKARQMLQDQGAEVFAVPCDVSDRSQVEQMVALVVEHYGGIDILVNNAGQIRVAPLENTTVEEFEKAMGVMFWGVIYPTFAVLPEMRRRGAGRIATITSIGGKVSLPHLLPYSCAKFAAVGFCEGLHAEVKRYGIHVTTVVPGLMRTGSHRNAVFGGEQQKEANWFGLGASLPGLSINAERAARQIVRNIRAGKTEMFLTPQARLLASLHAVCPGYVTDALSYVNKLLPSPVAGEHRTVAGREVEGEQPGWWKTATVLGRRAANQLNNA